MKNVAILISGSGTNMESILNSCNNKDFKVKCVVASEVGTRGLEVAESFGVDVTIVKRSVYSTKKLFEKVLTQILDDYKTDYIVLAGYMVVLSNNFVKKYHKRIFNTHPSLLPDHPGLNAVEKSLQSGKAGFTIHYVDPGPVDSGEIIFQKEVEIKKEDVTFKIPGKLN